MRARTLEAGRGIHAILFDSQADCLLFQISHVASSTVLVPERLSVLVLVWLSLVVVQIVAQG